MKGMKLKSLLAILLILIVAGGGVFAADSKQDTMQLKGQVGYNTSVSILTSVGSTFDITPNVNITEAFKVAEITEKSNKPGYSIVITSTNLGKLVNPNSEAGEGPVTYTVVYNTTDVSTGTYVSLGTAYTPLDTTGTKTGISGVVSFLYIKVEVPSTVYTYGDYVDTLTITMNTP